MNRWIRAVVAVLRDVPRQVSFELERRRWHHATALRWRGLTDAAVWRCRLHAGDVILVRNGGFYRVAGTLIVPVLWETAVDHHGYEPFSVRGES